MESAWAEIRDTVVDHGGAWPNGSPRAIGEEMSSRLDAEEAASMGRVATLVERARYARTFTDTDAAAQLPTVTQEIRHGIAAPLSPFRRLLAVVLPGRCSRVAELPLGGRRFPAGGIRLARSSPAQGLTTAQVAKWSRSLRRGACATALPSCP